MLCLSGKRGNVQNDRVCDPTGVVKVCLSLAPPTVDGHPDVTNRNCPVPRV